MGDAPREGTGAEARAVGEGEALAPPRGGGEALPRREPVGEEAAAALGEDARVEGREGEGAPVGLQGREGREERVGALDRVAATDGRTLEPAKPRSESRRPLPPVRDTLRRRNKNKRIPPLDAQAFSSPHRAPRSLLGDTIVLCSSL